MQLKAANNENSNDVVNQPTNDRPPIKRPIGNQDQTDINAAAYCRTFLMSICVLVLILI